MTNEEIDKAIREFVEDIDRALPDAIKRLAPEILEDALEVGFYPGFANVYSTAEDALSELGTFRGVYFCDPAVMDCPSFTLFNAIDPAGCANMLDSLDCTVDDWGYKIESLPSTVITELTCDWNTSDVIRGAQSIIEDKIISYIDSDAGLRDIVEKFENEVPAEALVQRGEELGGDYPDYAHYLIILYGTGDHWYYIMKLATDCATEVLDNDFVKEALNETLGPHMSKYDDHLHEMLHEIGRRRNEELEEGGNEEDW